MDLSKEDITESAQQMQEFLNHGFDSVQVEHVESEEVTQRTTIGFDAEEAREQFQAYYRVKVNSESRDDILETRGDMIDYFRNQLLQMETQSRAPDTMLVETDFPPEHIDKPLVFYVRSTL